MVDGQFLRSGPHRLCLGSIFLVLLAGVLSACSSPQTQGSIALAPLKDMPSEIQHAPGTVSEAYQFAAANPTVLQGLPCYCGCDAMGHASNYDCFVADVRSDGGIEYDTHALGCSICVDIAQDAMRMSSQGEPLSEIRSYIDSTYARYGPSNMP